MPFLEKKTKEQVLAELFPGKTEDEIKRMVNSFADLEAKANKVAGLETQLATSNTELANVKVKLQEIDASRNNNNNNNNNNNQNNNNNNNVTEAPRWDEDAQAAFNHNIAPLVGETLKTRAELVYETVTARLERTEPLFSNAQIRKEFDETIKKSSLQAQASRDYVENCYYVVVGKHNREIEHDRLAGSGTFFVETGRNQGNQNNNNNNNNQNDASTRLTADEEKEAAKFGLTKEQWLKTRNAIRFVGGGVMQTEMR